jgi:AbrB family looped-hinge helix DNA binding protein
LSKDAVLATFAFVARVTSKLQVTIPKAVADAHGIKPGAEIEFESAGDVIRVRPRRRKKGPSVVAQRLAAFDEATARQNDRDKELAGAHEGRGWRREDLYDRGLPR